VVDIQYYFLNKRIKPYAVLGEHPADFSTLSVEAGKFDSADAGLMGRSTRLPLQLGQIKFSKFSAHALQNVHSKLQIIALSESGGKFLLQHSQLGLSASMLLP
jgi:hypothetical protein